VIIFANVTLHGNVCKYGHDASTWHKICICVYDHSPHKTHIPSPTGSLIITITHKGTTSFKATEMQLIEVSLSETAEDGKNILQYQSFIQQLMHN
jgi:hypothetical protein